MAKYRLLRPHFLDRGPAGARQSGLVEAGEVIDSAELPPWFKPTPHMVGLDPEAQAAIVAICDQIRNESGSKSVPSIGNMEKLPGGELEGVR